ncbi:MAG TPA: M56 family metallopeptidase [Candidatus Solibacter sp.]|nr:M56 family metallopeptidase [Candidatus Solibacter sp.]
MDWELETIARMSAAGIVDSLVIGSAVAIFAALMLKMPRRSDSGTRFAVWFAALMTIAGVPFVGRLSAAAVVAGSHSFGRAVLTLPGSWAVYALAAWAAVAVWGLVRVGIGFWHVHALRRRCQPVDAEVLEPLVRVTLDKNACRGLVLCVSDEVQVPTAIGLVKPAVVLPQWVMKELSGAELNQILLHELAHLRRFDDWTNLAQKIVKALFFFHPAVWWIERKISLEREMACDDAVLEETENPRAYAECLAHLAEKTFIQRSIALAQAALGKMRQTSLRVAQILNRNRDREGSSGLGWKLGVPVLAGFAVVCVAGIARAPRLVAFSDGGTSVAPNAARVSFDAGSPIAIPATRVGWKISVGAAPKPAVHLQSYFVPRAKQAPLKRNGPRKAAPLLAENEPAPRMEDLMRQARLSPPALIATPVFATQAVYVVFEGRGFGVSDRGVPGQAVYEIRVWRLVVFHPVVDPDKKTPHKET